MNRALRVLSTALITAGIVIAGDVASTLLWKEPLSAAYGALQQSAAEAELEEVERRFSTRIDLPPSADSVEERVAILAQKFETQLESGDPIGRIQVDSIDLDAVMVEGTDTASLREGPGHYTASPDTATRALGDGSGLPGQGKTVGVAGHRTTYLAPFKRLNELKKEDELVLEMPYGTFTYEVEKTKIVDPSAYEVVQNVSHERLVLTACHPLYSAAQRIVTFGKLTDVSLFGSGERLWQDP